MSRSVDNRVVEMTFDNKQFERNVETSMGTIEKLKKTLNFNGTAKSIESLTAASKGANVDSLGFSIDSVKAKFTALQVIGMAVLANIANSAFESGKRLVKALSVDNIASGWEAYGKETTAVATLKAQGYAIKEIEDELAQLSWYTDETSYNFTDMVENAGKFTAAGNGLHESVRAMEGIANWAALSGQNASVASRVMYQLAQATGRALNRQDWASVMSASMDSQEIRQKMIEAGVAAQTLKKIGDDIYETQTGVVFSFDNFLDSLTEGAWATPRVMMDVYNSYAGAVDDIFQYTEEHKVTATEAIADLEGAVDEFGLKAFRAAQEAHTWTDVVNSIRDAVTSKWKDTFKLIIGNEEEATSFYGDLATGLYNVFTASSEIRNEILEGWNELGGREDLLKIFWNIWNAIASVVNPIKEAFRNVFPRKTAQDLKTFTENLADFTSKMILSEEKADKLRTVFEKIFRVFKSVGDLIKSILPSGETMQKIFSAAGKVLEFVFTAAAKVIDFIRANFGDDIQNILSFIGDSFKNIAHWLSGIVDDVRKIVQEGKDEGKSVFQIFTDVGKFLVQGLWTGIVSAAGEAIRVIKEFCQGLWDKVTDFFGVHSPSKLFMALGGFLIAGLIIGIQNEATPLLAKVKQFCTDLLNEFNIKWNYEDSIFGKLFGKKSDIKEGSEAITNAANGISTAYGVMGPPLHQLTDALSGDGSVTENIKSFFGRIGDILVAFFQGPGFTILSKLAAGGILFLIGKELLSFYKMFKTFLKGIASLGGIVTNVQKITGNVNTILQNFAEGGLAGVLTGSGGKKTTKIGTFFKEVGATVLMLAASLAVIAMVAKSGYLDESLEAMERMVAVVTAVIGGFNTIDLLFSTTGGTRNIEAISGFFKSIGIAILAMSLGIGIMAKVAENGHMDDALAGIEEMLLAVGGFLGVFAVADHFSGLDGLEDTQIEKLAKAFLKISAGLLVISLALAITAKTASGKYLDDAITAMEYALGGMTAAIFIFSEIDKSYGKSGLQESKIEMLAKAFLKMSAGLLVISLALAVTAQAVAGKDLFSVIAPLAIMTFALVMVVGIFAGLDMKLSESGLDGSKVEQMGNVFLKMSAALLIMSIALTIVAMVVGTGKAWEGIGALAVMVVLLVAAVAGLAAINTFIGNVGVVSGALLALSASLIIMSIALTMVALIPSKQLWNAVGAIAVLMAVLVGLAAISGLALVMAGLVVLSGAILALALSVMIIASGVQQFVAALYRLSTIDPEKITAVLNAIADTIPTFGRKIGEGLGNMFIGLAETVVEGIAHIVDRVKEFLGIHSPSTVFAGIGDNIIAGLIGGIKEKINDAVESIKELARKIKEGISEKWEEFKNVGKDLINGLKEGITSKFKEVKEAATNIVSGAVTAVKNFLGIHSPSRVFKEIGQFSGAGLVNGLLGMTSEVRSAALGLGESSVNGMQTAISRVAEALDSELDYQPRISPVLDLDNVRKGASSISALLNRGQAMEIGSMIGSDASADQNGLSSGTTYSFVQNNYSPKALSRIDIYRQTKNQFAAIERMTTT